jgi:hypothetical protein
VVPMFKSLQKQRWRAVTRVNFKALYGADEKLGASIYLPSEQEAASDAEGTEETSSIFFTNGIRGISKGLMFL